MLDALGLPIAACTVHVATWGSAPQPVADGLSDGEGFFVIPVPLDDRALRVDAASPGRVAATSYARVGPARRTARVVLRLWDAGTIRGRVTDANGEAVAGADVLAVMDESRVFGFEPQATAVTDEEGRFTLTGVALGWNQVRAWKDGCALAQASTWLRGEADVALELAASPGVRLEVRVAGLPEGVDATVSSLPYAAGGFRALPRALTIGTVASGSPWVRTGLPDLEYRVSVRAAGYTFAPDEARFAVGAAPHRVEFQATAIAGGGEDVARNPPIRGVLRGPDGRPLAGEHIECRHHQGGVRTTAVTDEDGHFELAAPRAPGTPCILYLVDSAYVTAQAKTDELLGSWDARFLADHEFVVGAETTLDVRAERAAVVSGRLVDAAGVPVRWLRVQLQEALDGRMPHWMTFAYAESDRDGRFRFAGVNPPRRQLRVVAGPGDSGASASGSFELAFGQSREGLAIEVAAPGSVAGQVLDANGTPIPGARVWLRNHDLATDRQTDGSVREVLADRDGRYRFVDVEPGGHRIEVNMFDSPLAAGASPVFEVRAGEEASITVELP